MPVTGSAVPEAMPTTWPALPASPANASCPRGKSSAWWKRRCSAGSTTTPWWRTSNEPQRAVSPPAVRHPRRRTMKWIGPELAVGLGFCKGGGGRMSVTAILEFTLTLFPCSLICLSPPSPPFPPCPCLRPLLSREWDHPGGGCAFRTRQPAQTC